MSARPESLGLSSSRLEAIDKFVQRKYIEPGRMPCGQILVWRRGETAHFSTFGMADVERKKALKDDTIFRIYSMTKPVTSVATMMLVEQGLIALDEPVHKYIPAWKDLGVYQGGFMETFRTKRPDRPMLIVDLLRHTSGLTYGFQQSTNVDAAYRKHKIGEIEKHGTLEEMVQKLATIPLEFSPGTAWNYSVSTDILGYIVGKVSGQKFEDFLRAKIFKPLGMVDTDFHVHAGQESRLAACYAATPKGTMDLQDDPTKSPYLEAPSLVSGGGGLVSTARDYLKFCRMLINGGTFEGTQILSLKTIQLMTVNHLPDGKDLPALSRSLFSEATYNGIGFGLGFSVTMDPAKTLIPGTVGEYSWGGAASTSFWIDPKEQLITIFLTQLLPSSAYPIRRELRTMVYSAFTD
jgi:CubicO group peptidase (beta-lactamase class C family)